MQRNLFTLELGFQMAFWIKGSKAKTNNAEPFIMRSLKWGPNGPVELDVLGSTS